MTQAATAHEKLQLSNLRQLEGMREDIDLEHLSLQLKSKPGYDLREFIEDASFERTIEGASTFTVKVRDKARDLWNSQRLGDRVDVNIDGLWFRLVKVGKNQDTLTLVFEDREAAVLRLYDHRRVTSKNTMTREQFVEILIKEVQEFKLPYVIPALKTQKPIKTEHDTRSASDRAKDREPGFGFAPKVTVKGSPATWEQIHNADIILSVAHSMGLRRKLLVIGIMTATQESSIRNLPYPQRGAFNYLSRDNNYNPRGVFQQIKHWGWPASGDVAVDARAFFQALRAVDAEHPLMDYAAAAETVQRSGTGQYYAQWRREAEHTVTQWGISGFDNEDSAKQADDNTQGQWTYQGSSNKKAQWTRGWEVTENGRKKWNKETTWDCTLRLASEVQMRRFLVSGTFYFISEPDLFKSAPLAVLSEDSEGVDWIDTDYDVGKKNAEVRIQCRVSRWRVPPGATLTLEKCGPLNGKWLVSSIERNIFAPLATITLTKPRARLPEPKDDAKPGDSWGNVSQGKHQVTGRFMNPLATPMPKGSEFLVPDREGAPDRFGRTYHAALDWMAPGGSRLVAPIAGRLVELKPSVGSSGQIFGGVVKLQEEGTGYVWVFRHVAPEQVFRLGAKVDQGTVLATVVRWQDNPSSSHSHIEVWRTLQGGYHLENMVDPFLYIQGEAT